MNSRNKALLFLIFFGISYLMISCKLGLTINYELEIQSQIVNKIENYNTKQDGANWIPIEQSFIPEIKTCRKKNLQEYSIIEYDCVKKEELIKLCDSKLNSSIDRVEPYEGLFSSQSDYSLLHSSYIFTPDGREKVEDTTVFPVRTICKLYIIANDGGRFIGSGAIIDNFHVLTCGHCVYLHDHGGWAADIEVVPAMDGPYWPYGSAHVSYMRSYTEWTVLEMPEHDWAVLTLDKSLGLITGWMGRKTEDPSHWIYTDTAYSAGYPGDLEDGEFMYFDADLGDRADEYNHWYWIDSAGGQSGSPIWTFGAYIITIHTRGYIFGGDANFGTRLNTNKFQDINTWLSEDASSPPNDKADLKDKEENSTLNIYKLIAGQTNFRITCEVENIGTANASSFDISFYASEDNIITPSDYLIGLSTVQDLGVFDYVSIEWQGTFPTSIPGGRYYIGWIIDVENSIEEYREDNNIGLISHMQLVVLNPFTITIIIIASISGIIMGYIYIVVSLIRYIKQKVLDVEDKHSSLREITPQEIVGKTCLNCGYRFKNHQPSRFCPSCGSGLSNDKT